MPRNDAAAPGHICPGIRIHATDIVQVASEALDAHDARVPCQAPVLQVIEVDAAGAPGATVVCLD